MTIQEQADAILARKCPDCTDGTQPSTWVDDEQPRKLCASCDGAGIVADGDNEPTEADEFMLRLAQDRDALLAALRKALPHVQTAHARNPQVPMFSADLAEIAAALARAEAK